MDLRFTPDELAFRDEVRGFFRREIPGRIRRKVSEGRVLAREEHAIVQRILNLRGWAVPQWPVEWGGQNWTAVQHAIFTDELMLAAVPLLPFNTTAIGPLLLAFGTEAQKRRFLPRIASLDDWWCQGFSEPAAGSDLASLRTRAARDGDHYIVDGQKTWTTLGHYADWIFALVRTDAGASKQMGISLLLIDMTSPGVSLRPIETIDGRHEVNEVFFDGVRVPADNLVGEENRGWDYAKFLLSYERIGIAQVGMSQERVARIKKLARRMPAGPTRADDGSEPPVAGPVDAAIAGGTMWADESFRHRLASLEVELKALEITQMRALAASASASAAEAGEGGRKLDPISSILKLKGTELQQAATELLLELAGPQLLAARPASGLEDVDWASLVAPFYLNNRKVSIYGGANEIQRNVIAKSILDL